MVRGTPRSTSLKPTGLITQFGFVRWVEMELDAHSPSCGLALAKGTLSPNYSAFRVPSWLPITFLWDVISF